MIVAALATGLAASATTSTAPLAAPDLVFDEADGLVVVEAEHFYKQTLADKRAWHITSSKRAPAARCGTASSRPSPAAAGRPSEYLPPTRPKTGWWSSDGERHG